MEEVVILSAKRTPIGKFKGALANFSAVRLGMIALEAALAAAQADIQQVDQVIFGNVLSAGNGQNIARQIAVNSGLSYEIPAMTINEVCGSGMKALIAAWQLIRLGEANLVAAGGTESMSQAGRFQKFDYETQAFQEAQSVMLQDGLMDAFSGGHMGITAENVAVQYQIEREEQDRFALLSQQKAVKAQAAHAFAKEIIPIELADGTLMIADESIRPQTSLEKLAALKPAFLSAGTVTAGNCSPINDGAAAVVLASKSYAEKNGLPYLAILEDYSEVGVDPALMGIAPTKAIEKLLKKTKRSLADIDLFQINEAFASASIAVQKELAIPDEKLNCYGGAIALGHPIGATGARIVATLISELDQLEKEQGIASLCIGGGLGLAVLVRKPKETAKKFYQLTKEERLEQLEEKQVLTPKTAELLRQDGLPEAIGAHLSENQISDFSIPLGVVPDYPINGKSYQIPLATEEPSVVAAASNAGKIIGKAGGFSAEVLGNWMLGQIVFCNLQDGAAIRQKLAASEAELLELAETCYPSIVRRGGGVKKLRWREMAAGYLSVDVLVDTKDAMGANILNTILEGLAEQLRRWFPEEEILFSILSNYATESLVRASCRIPTTLLGTKQYAGEQIARRLAQASDYAKLDPYRAATHNKGIFNGIDGLILATGNDTRAVAAAGHAYAARSGAYQGLSTWTVEANELVGELVLPLAVGTVGGATKILPKAQAALEILQLSHSDELAQVAAALGLGQNFAALKALVTDGIQRGHMAMQARTLAMTVGATGDEVATISRRLLKAAVMDTQTAEKLLCALRQS